jgi:hypothetical protein
MIHIHHIIPKHMGGTDEPDNLIELTIEEHAEAHRKLYEEHKNEYDRIAWLSLSGQINISEAKRLAQKEGAKLGAKISNEKRRLNGNTIGDWNRETGHVRTIATKESCQKGGSAAGKKLIENGKWKEIQSLGGKIGGKIASQIVAKQRWKCNDCDFISTPGGVGNHQRKTKHIGKEKLICQQ